MPALLTTPRIVSTMARRGVDPNTYIVDVTYRGYGPDLAPVFMNVQATIGAGDMDPAFWNSQDEDAEAAYVAAGYTYPV